jgi:large subunit ribosomal protein L1
MAEAKKKAAKTTPKEKIDGTIQESVTAATEANVEERAEAVAETKVAKTTKAGKHSVKAQKEAAALEAKEARKASKAESDADEPKKTVKKPARTRLERAGKKLREVAKLVDREKLYTAAEAVELAAKTSPTKFDATVELHINLNIDPRQADQNLRDTLVLPSGIGKTVRVVIADDELLKKLDKGVIEFDVLVASPEFMPKLGKYARVLGPKGLMPNPKSGTVSTDVNKAVKEAQAGRVEYRVDSTGIVHLGVGKVSFGPEKLLANVQTVFASIKAAKPGSIKSTYVKTITITTTMGPGIKISPNEL